jgi:hypothetical protein
MPIEQHRPGKLYRFLFAPNFLALAFTPTGIHNLLAHKAGSLCYRGHTTNSKPYTRLNPKALLPNHKQFGMTNGLTLEDG